MGLKGENNLLAYCSHPKIIFFLVGSEKKHMEDLSSVYI